MANPNLIWVRDAMLTTADQGDADTYGTRAVDLLWKARTGDGIQSANPLSHIKQDMAATPKSQSDPKGIHSLGVSAQAMPGQLPIIDIAGAVVKRIRLTWNVYLAPNLGDSVGNHSHRITEGAYVGILVIPGSLASYVVDDNALGPHPGGVRGAVQWDWLHWERVYAMNQGQKYFAMQAGGVSSGEIGFSYDIDTRCSRRITEQGSSLYFFTSASPGHTINGWSAAWSVLLQTPSG